ncbi:hypothetical protein [Gilliamella sp. Fer4-1]|jgi:hypothetical protein|uniref:hypothetical protein n=1 Tax=Gilliamella sp. Fer4-1 TaxID=3120242 RepID=UPI00080EC24B|nr:hypothetical protein [Gilliamella apicola]OCG60289.1 hypothetical protein A9G30_10900 [Gilliamella apicola]
MPLINLKKTRLNNEDDDIVLYRTFHENNGRYLEREDEPEKFKVLWNIDDSSPSVFKSNQDINMLMQDIEVVLNEAHSQNDNEMCNHLKEIFVLCKLCLWNNGMFYLEFTPWGVKLDSYPSNLPDKFKFNISTIDN